MLSEWRLWSKKKKTTLKKKIILTFGKESVAEWAHHQAHKAREHTSPWEEGWKLRGMPSSHIQRKMRPYPGCDRGRGNVRSAATAVHQAMKLLPGPGKPEGKKIKNK